MKNFPVKAAPDLKVPYEGNPRKYITDGEPVLVPDVHYYRKAVAEGDLIEVTAKEWAEYDAARTKAEAEAVAAAEEQAKAIAAAAVKAAKASGKATS
ncbi:hypothetical protein EDC30_102220 [Paucimonas lemoignei]|uniref:DUF2635 domain-containing protein n=1 Tax=Paucimonas lemoignei TaxID=29443 RepID=A0A4R3I1A5_PAULE|nr:hypothetical protein [Paucimonas lemoignei]TCS38481.1 hypothetical protein EDC30_102220 [Paucimonas lemoignei]